MEHLTFHLDAYLVADLNGLLGRPLMQVDFRKVIPNGTVGTLPMTMWAGGEAVTIAYGSDEFPISPFDFYPLSNLTQSINPSQPAKGSDTVVHLQGQALTHIDIVRAKVRGFFQDNQFLDIEVDLSVVLRTDAGFIALQRTYLDDFAVNISLGGKDDALELIAPDFSGETDHEYRYDVELDVLSLT